MKRVNEGYGGARDYKPDASVCMVPDCQRKALYRSRISKHGRGYCSIHRDHAKINDESSIEWLARKS